MWDPGIILSGKKGPLLHEKRRKMCDSTLLTMHKCIERTAPREAEPPPASAEAAHISLSVSSQVVCLFWTRYRVFIQSESNVRPF